MCRHLNYFICKFQIIWWINYNCTLVQKFAFKIWEFKFTALGKAPKYTTLLHSCVMLIFFYMDIASAFKLLAYRENWKYYWWKWKRKIYNTYKKCAKKRKNYEFWYIFCYFEYWNVNLKKYIVIILNLCARREIVYKCDICYTLSYM